MYKLFFDGSKKDRTISAAYIIYRDNEIIHKETVTFENSGFSSNVAEYLGIIHGLIACIQLGITEVEVFGDSQLVIYQITGKNKTKSENMKILNILVSRLKIFFDDIEFNWIPREKNTEADRQSKINYE